MLQLPSAGLWWSVGLVVSLSIIHFLRRLHFQRSLVAGLPGPPHNYVFGSLISMAKALTSQPRDAAPQTFLLCLKEYWNLPDVFYFDPWPMGPPIMAILMSKC